MPIYQLPTDPSDEELARDWNLSADDLTEVRRCRGDANRHRFAIQLCALRGLGCFVNDFGDVPVRIVNHVGRQFGLPPALFISPLERPATATDHTQRIRQYLGYQPFDDRVQERLGRFLGQRAVEGILAGSLFTVAIDALRAWMVELPAQSTLERLVASCAAHGEEAMWRRIQERLSPEFCTTVDTLLTVPEIGSSPDSANEQHRGICQINFRTELKPSMTPARWEQISHLYHAALKRHVNDRAAFLAEACAGDNALRRLRHLGGAQRRPQRHLPGPAIQRQRRAPLVRAAARHLRSHRVAGRAGSRPAGVRRERGEGGPRSRPLSEYTN